MFGFGSATRIYLAARATDLRQGFEGLYGLARDSLMCDPLSGHVLLFGHYKINRPTYQRGRRRPPCAGRIKQIGSKM
jgi:hypothetical protein